MRLLSALALCVGLVACSGSDDSPAATAPEAAPIALTVAQLASARAESLPPPPRPVSGAAELFATERGILLWGIRDAESRMTAALYSPAEKSWRTFDYPPLSTPISVTGNDSSVVWNGRDLLLFGRESLALDIVSGKWRKLAPMPKPTAVGAYSVWTGSNVVVIGQPGEPSADRFVGYSFDPIANIWKSIAPPPEPIYVLKGFARGGVLLAGHELLIVGKTADPALSVFFIYDLATDKWRRSPFTLAGSALLSGAIAQETAYYAQFSNKFASLTLATGTINQLPAPNEGRAAQTPDPVLLVVGNQVVALDESTMFVLNRDASQWVRGASVAGNVAVVADSAVYVVETMTPSFTRVRSG